MLNNTAFYVDSEGTVSIKRDFPIPQPEEAELLIEVLYSGINPADIKHSDLLGIYSTVLGYDFSGRVISAPSNSAIVAGDLVAGYTPSNVGRPARFGAHQNYLACPPQNVFKVPANVPLVDAATLMVVTMTAIDAVHNQLSLPLPGPNPAAVEGTLIIWGGGTAVGICAIQLARAAGVRSIFVAASPARHDLLKKLGASHCFDYHRDNVVAEIQEALGTEKTIFGFDAAGLVDTGELLAKAVGSGPAKVALTSVVPQQDSRFGVAMFTRDVDTIFHFPGAPAPSTIPAQRNEGAKMWSALKWVLDNYGAAFQLPSVTTFDGSPEEALLEMRKIQHQGRFGKLVLKHPFN